MLQEPKSTPTTHHLRTKAKSSRYLKINNSYFKLLNQIALLVNKHDLLKPVFAYVLQFILQIQHSLLPTEPAFAGVHRILRHSQQIRHVAH